MIEQMLGVLSYAGAAVAGLVVKMIWDKLKNIEKRADTADARADSIEKNYIYRFEKVQEQLTNTKEEIIGKITDLQLLLAENYATKGDTYRRTKRTK
jgi:hypothetical protein